MEKNVNLSGLCLDKITSTFPLFPLRDVEKDIHRGYMSSRTDPNDLPKLPNCVGGNRDLMIGISYFKYYPKEIFCMPNGLKFYESQFSNSMEAVQLLGVSTECLRKYRV